jgi:hypothetical protein
MLLEHAIKCLISLLVSLCKDSSGCWHNTGMSSHPSDHTCDSAPSKHILYWCCDLIFVQRTQLGKEEGQKVERWEDKLAVSDYFEYFWVAFCQKLVEKQTNHASFQCAQFWCMRSGCVQGVFWAQSFLPLGRRSSIETINKGILSHLQQLSTLWLLLSCSTQIMW